MRRAGLLAGPWLLAFGCFAIVVSGDQPIPGSPPAPAPVAVSISHQASVLTVGESIALSVTVDFADGSSATDPPGTFFSTYLEEEVIRVDEAGLLTAVAPGVGFVKVSNWNFQGRAFDVLTVEVRAVGDTDGDTLPDAFEVAAGLDPTQPGDAGLDLDGDDLSNLEEFQLGTDVHLFDTDGDRLGDGYEDVLGLDPLTPEAEEPPADDPLAGCLVSVANRSATADAAGSWFIPGVPSNVGPVRARVTCIEGATVEVGASEPFVVPAGEGVRVEEIDFTSPPQVLATLSLQPETSLLEDAAETLQLTAVATFPDGSVADVTAAEAGTRYRSTNENIADVEASGLVTPLSSGRVLVTAVHEGVLALATVDVLLAGDSDGDGLPDDFELANGLNPNDPLDALLDPDLDGLSTLDEFQSGLDPFDSDTDDDGLLDGEEVNIYGTNPLLSDTDGDGVSDGLEVQAGSDPLDDQSVDLSGILDSLEVFPPAVTIVFNTIVGEASQQLRVTATLIDGSSVDVTSNVYGTSYSSSDLLVANFGLDDGRVFAGTDGLATVTASVGGLSVDSAITVQTVAPTAVAFLPIPGYANAIDLEGSYAFIAAGTGGLQVVDISDPALPTIVGSAEYPGIAFGLDVQGTLAYVVGTSVQFQSAPTIVYDVADPFQPVQVGTSTVGHGTDIAIGDGFALMAGSTRVASFDLSDPLQPVFEDLVSFSGYHPRSVVLQDDRAFVGLGLGVAEIDVSDPAAITLVAITPTRQSGSSNTGGLAARGDRLYAADGFPFALGGVRVADIEVPGSAAIVGTTSADMAAVDVAVDGDFAFVADYAFVNAVPILGLESDLLDARGAIDFSGAPSFRDDNGTGIAARDGWVYLVAGQSFGKQPAGDSGLHVGRAYVVQDTFGQAPTVEVTSPADGSSVLERRRLVVLIDASDDVALSAVELLVDGQLVGADHAPPFSFEVQVPAGAGQLALSAIARDSAGDESQTPDTVVTVLADQQPTVRIVAPTGLGRASEGSALAFVADATDDVAVSEVELFLDGVSLALLSEPPYTQSLVVPLGVSQVTLSATARDELGQEASAVVVLGVDPDQAPSVAILEPPEGTVLLPWGFAAVSIGADDDVGVATLRLLVDGQVVASTPGSSLEEVVAVPVGATDVVVRAEVDDSLGQSSHAELTYAVVADPDLDVTGTVVQEDGSAAVGADVDCAGTAATSGANGAFLAQGVSTATGQVACTATWTSPQNEERSGISKTVFLSSGEPVNVGAIVIGSATLYGALDQFETAGGITVIDPADASGSILSDPVTPGAIRGVDFDDSGVLVGVETSAGSPVLFEIDSFGGLGLESVGPVVDGSSAPVPLFDLAVQPLTGTLFGATAAGDVYWVDRSTAVATLFVSTGMARPGLDFLPSGQLYLAGEASLGVYELRELDPADGSTLGVVPMGIEVVALASRPADSALFFLDGGGRLLTLDPVTGTSSLVDTPFGNPGGLAFGPPVTALADTTATGRFLVDGVPTGGVIIALGGQEVMTAADGTFQIPGTPAVFGPLVAVAPEFDVFSDAVEPVAGGTTDLGDMVFDEPTQ